MHVFSFIPDRLLLSRKCYELIPYAGGSCLLSSTLYYFSFTAPTVPLLVHTERCYSQLPICGRLRGACLLTNGPEERPKENPVRVSQRCAAAAAAAAIWGVEGKRKREREEKTSFKKFFKKLKQAKVQTQQQTFNRFIQQRCWNSRCVWKRFEQKHSLHHYHESKRCRVLSDDRDWCCFTLWPQSELSL